MAPRVARGERASLLVLRRRADESLTACAGQCVDGVVEPALGECFGFASPRPESGTPKQALGLLRAELSVVHGNLGCRLRQNVTLRVSSAVFATRASLEWGIPVSSHRARGTEYVEMEIAGLGIAMIAVSILLLVWAFPSLPAREPARRR